MLPNGFNVYPEDIENALRIAGIRDSVVLETRPGGSRRSSCRPIRRRTRPRRRLASMPRSRPPTRPSARTSAIAGWRLWPGEDFPRTHTLKVKRDQVRTWAAVEATLPVSEGS